MADDKNLEPGALAWSTQPFERELYSIAVSLKRIADIMDRPVAAGLSEIKARSNHAATVKVRESQEPPVQPIPKPVVSADPDGKE